MATLTIRKLDPEVRDRLRVRAAEHGRSMEAEARKILAEACAAEPQPANAFDAMRRHFHGETTMDLAPPPRDEGRPPPIFD